ADGGQHDLERRPPGLGVLLDGDAAAVVADQQAAVHVDLDVDVVAVAGQGLVHAVVDQLVGHVVQAVDADVADVDAGSTADVGGVAQDLHVVAAVLVGGVAGGLLLGGQGGVSGHS